MARVAQQNAQGAESQYNDYAKAAMGNYNTQAAAASDDISALEAQGNPYQQKSFLQNQNKLAAGAMNAQNSAAKEQLQGQALRTGTNTAALGRTISSNARAGQRQLDSYQAERDNANQDKYQQLEQNIVGMRQNQANSQANVLGTTSGRQLDANGQLVTLNGQNQAMWGQIIAGAAGGAGAAFGAHK